MHKLDSIEKQVAGLRYDHRLLFDVLNTIEHKVDTPSNVNRTSLQIFSENQSLINQPLIKTPISTEDELEAVEAKLINDQNHEFRSQLVSDIFIILMVKTMYFLISFLVVYTLSTL